MNIYRIQFVSKCPINEDMIIYSLEIQKDDFIPAEAIEKACDVKMTLHENLANNLFREFGGRQTLTAVHGRVEIQTIRGDL
jgi:hypothetical protein